MSKDGIQSINYYYQKKDEFGNYIEAVSYSFYNDTCFMFVKAIPKRFYTYWLERFEIQYSYVQKFTWVDPKTGFFWRLESTPERNNLGVICSVVYVE